MQHPLLHLAPDDRTLADRAVLMEDVFDSLAVEVAVVDQDGTIVATNEAWKRFALENGGADSVGGSYFAPFEDDVPGLSDGDAQAAARGLRSVLDGSAQSFTMEYPCHSATEQRWFQMRVAPLREPRRGAVVTHENITERKKAEQSLRLFRDLMDYSMDSLEVVDPATGRFLDVNERACRERGYSREEYLSKRVADVNPTVTEETWPEVAASIRAAGSTTHGGIHTRQDGTTFPVEINARWVQLDRDYIVAVVRDVSERQRAEERLSELAAMLDLAQDAIIVYGFEDQKVTFWSKGAESTYGWSAAEAIGQKIGELIFEDQTRPDALAEALLAGGERRGDGAHRAKSGRSLIVNSHSTLVRDAAGQPKSVLLINLDITEQKRLATHQLRAQRMESIGVLASGIAHDLGNILSPIKICVPLLRQKVAAEIHEELISTIETSTDRGVEIVKQILTFGRGLEGEKVPLQLGALVDELLGMVRRTFPKAIEIESTMEPPLDVVIGDVTQLHQVLLNVCMNARDAMPQGGTLRLHAANLEVDAAYASMLLDAKPGPYVLLEISDTGTGIPPEIVEHMFEPFFTTKEIGHGTGLGLSTVLGIVQSHGGFINIKTKPGKGTTFQIGLPAQPNRKAPHSRAMNAKPVRGNGECVLVVDDEAAVRTAARLAMENAGYQVLLASDGAHAVTVFATERARIAMVVTDLNMPHVDGVALIRALRNLSPDLPIIVSTCLGERSHLAQLRELNVATILHKPYGADVLLRNIHEVLHGKAPRPVKKERDDR